MKGWENVKTRTLRRPPNIGVGQPYHMRLNQWGLLLCRAFDTHPYLVGSSLFSKQWRDVDVRLLLEDARFDAMFPGVRPGIPAEVDGLWNATCTAFAVWGREFTGLPIDFQIQRQSDANRLYPYMRSALGIIQPSEASQ